jgi:hypothetical protein
MKKFNDLSSLRNLIRCSAVAIVAGFFVPQSYAQTGGETTEQEIQTDTIVADSPETVEKIALRVSFEAFKINEEVQLIARARSKVGTKFQNTAGVEINFYNEEVVSENLIGKIITDHKGEASLKLEQVQTDSMVPATYYAVVSDHPDYEDVEEMVTVNPSIMEMELMEEDSLKIVKIFIGYPDETGQKLPLPEVECNLYVKRLFGLLLIAEAGTTDEEGNIQFEFPIDVPGDGSGNVEIVARVKEHESLGNVEVSKSIAWGTPAKVNTFDQERRLWSSSANSPILLIVVVTLTLLGIWGVIGFIFLEIFRINKLGRADRKAA